MRAFGYLVVVGGLLSVILVGCGVADSLPSTASPLPNPKSAVDPPSTEYIGSEPKFPNRVYTAIVFEPSTLPMTAPHPLEVVFFSTFSRNISATVSVSLTTSGVLAVDPPTVAQIVVPGLGSGILTTTFRVDHEGFGQIIAFVTVDPIVAATDTPPCPLHYAYYQERGFLASKIGIFQGNEWGSAVDNYLKAAVEHHVITIDEHDEIQRKRRRVSTWNEVIIMGVDGPLDDPPAIDIPIAPIPDC